MKHMKQFGQWINEATENLTNTTSIHSLASEMQSFVKVDPTILAAAKASNITDANNTGMKKLVKAWSEGKYDEDPDYVISEIETLLAKEKKR